MLSKYKERLKDKERRKFFVVFLGGKMIGVGLALLGVKFLMGLLPSPAGAQGTTPDVPQTDIINPINTAWVLVTAFLVFFMQAGFMMLEAGFARTRETVNILQECIVDTCLCGLLFWAFGFAFMFGEGNGWIGHEFFFLNDAPRPTARRASPSWRSSCSSSPSPTPARPSPPVPWSGAPASRATCSTASASAGFIYPILGHWVWGPGGWLATMDTPVP